MRFSWVTNRSFDFDLLGAVMSSHRTPRFGIDSRVYAIKFGNVLQRCSPTGAGVLYLQCLPHLPRSSKIWSALAHRSDSILRQLSSEFCVVHNGKDLSSLRTIDSFSRSPLASYRSDFVFTATVDSPMMSLVRRAELFLILWRLAAGRRRLPVSFAALIEESGSAVSPMPRGRCGQGNSPENFTQRESIGEKQ